MKAKHFKKLRVKARYFEVEVSRDLFGFPEDKEFDKDMTVLAYDHFHAAKRAYNRGLGRNDKMYPSYKTQRRWAGYRVKEQGKSNHWRNIFHCK